MAVGRWIARVVLWTVVALVVVVAAAVLVVETTWFKDWLRRYAVERAAQYLNADLSIDELGGSLFRGVSVDGLTLRQDGTPVVSADRVVVRYDPLRLWREGLAFDLVEVRNPTVHLVQTADGWNLANLVKERKTPSSRPAAFRIERLHVSGADVTVQPAKTERRQIDGVDLVGALSREAGAFTMQIDGLTGRDVATGYRIEHLDGSFDGTFQHADLTFRAASPTSAVGGHLTAEPTAGQRTLYGDVDLRHLDLAVLLDRPAWASDITGTASVRAVVPEGEAATTVSFEFRGPAASAFGYAGEHVDVTGQYTGDRVSFTGRADGYGAAVTVDGAIRLPETGGTATFTGSGTFAHADLARLPASLRVPRFRSRMTGRYRVATTPSGWNADVRLQPSTIEGASLAAGTTGQVDARGGIIRYESTGEVSDLDLQALSGPLDLPLLAQPRFESRINGTFHATGVEEPRHRQLTADATMHDSSVAGTTFGNLDLTAALDDRRLSATARGDFHGLTNALPDLPDRVPIDLSGTADIAFTLHDYDAPFTAEGMDVSGHVELGPSEVRGITIDDAVFDGALTGGVATLLSASVHAAGVEASAVGVAALGSTGASDLRVRVAADNLATLGDVLEKPLEGGALLQATITGPSSAAHVEGTLNGQALTYGETASAVALNTTFTADVPDRDITRVAGTATTDGTFVKVGGFDLVRATASTSYEDRRIAILGHLEETSRTLDLDGVVTLGDDGRDVQLNRLDLATAGALWSIPGDVPARVHVGANAVTIEGLTVANGGQRIDIGGRLALNDEGRSDEALSVRVGDVQVAEINRLLLGTRQLTGLVNGTATVRGTATMPDVDASMTIANGTVEGVPFDGVEAKVTYADGAATVNARLDQTPTNRLEIRGTVPVTAAAANRTPVDLSVTSNPIDLGLAQAFTTAVTGIGGTGTFDLHVTGTLKAPVVDGSMAIAGGTFSIAQSGVPYRNLNAQLAFDHNHLQIGTFTMEDDDKHVARATGGLDVLGTNGQRAFDVALQATDFHVIDNDLGLVQVDADVRAEGDFQTPRVTGTLHVTQARVEVDQVLEMTTKDVYSTTPQGPLEPAAAPAAAAEAATNAASGPLLDRIDLALQVTMPDNIVLRGRDLRMAGSSVGLGDMNIVAGGSLDIRKAPGQKLGITGAMEVVRGYYSFQGRRFQVERDSRVRFRGESPINPAIDVKANREISGVTTTVAVQGSVTDPTVTLSSTPPLDQADILSLIVFGQPVNDLGLSQRTSLSQRAAAMAASAIATPVADSVAQALNLDLFEIQTQGTGSATVSLGSQIGTRLYVGVKQDVGGTATTALTLEYRLAEFLRLVTSIVQGANEKNAASQLKQQSGLDLFFLFRY